MKELTSAIAKGGQPGDTAPDRPGYEITEVLADGLYRWSPATISTSPLKVPASLSVGHMFLVGHTSAIHNGLKIVDGSAISNAKTDYPAFWEYALAAGPDYSKVWGIASVDETAETITLNDYVTAGLFHRYGAIAGQEQEQATAKNGLSLSTNGSHTHGIPTQHDESSSGDITTGGGGWSGRFYTEASGNHTHTLTGDTETRPTNVSIIPAIVVKPWHVATNVTINTGSAAPTDVPEKIYEPLYIYPDTENQVLRRDYSKINLLDSYIESEFDERDIYLHEPLDDGNQAIDTPPVWFQVKSGEDDFLLNDLQGALVFEDAPTAKESVVRVSPGILYSVEYQLADFRWLIKKHPAPETGAIAPTAATATDDVNEHEVLLLDWEIASNPNNQTVTLPSNSTFSDWIDGYEFLRIECFRNDNFYALGGENYAIESLVKHPSHWRFIFDTHDGNYFVIEPSDKTSLATIRAGNTMTAKASGFNAGVIFKVYGVRRNTVLPTGYNAPKLHTLTVDGTTIVNGESSILVLDNITAELSLTLPAGEVLSNVTIDNGAATVKDRINGIVSVVATSDATLTATTNTSGAGEVTRTYSQRSTTNSSSNNVNISLTAFERLKSISFTFSDRRNLAGRSRSETFTLRELAIGKSGWNGISHSGSYRRQVKTMKLGGYDYTFYVDMMALDGYFSFKLQDNHSGTNSYGAWSAVATITQVS